MIELLLVVAAAALGLYFAGGVLHMLWRVVFPLNSRSFARLMDGLRHKLAPQEWGDVRHDRTWFLFECGGRPYVLEVFLKGRGVGLFLMTHSAFPLEWEPTPAVIGRLPARSFGVKVEWLGGVTAVGDDAIQCTATVSYLSMLVDELIPKCDAADAVLSALPEATPIDWPAHIRSQIAV